MLRNLSVSEEENFCWLLTYYLLHSMDELMLEEDGRKELQALARGKVMLGQADVHVCCAPAWNVYHQMLAAL